MDEESQELVKLAAEGGVEGFLRTVAPPLVEAGGWGADLIRRYRIRSAVKTLALANRWLEEAGLEAHVVSPKVLVPWLESSSLEEDPEQAADPEDAKAMQERWAALLANAAAGDQGAEVLPTFPRLLSELVPVEARMVELLGTEALSPPHRPSMLAFMHLAGFDPANDASQHTFAVHVDNLERLRLCEVTRPDAALHNFARVVDSERQSQTRRARRHFIGPSSGPSISISALGRAFVAACTPPQERHSD